MVSDLAGHYFWFNLAVACNALILFVLAANISRLRLKFKVSIGDEGNKTIMVAMRAQANGVEQVPIFLLLILGLTLTQSSDTALALLVIAFTFSRVAQAIGMLGRIFIARRIGAGLTYLLQLIASLLLLINLLAP